LEKYAVRMGNGTNHRMGLCDGLLIKDNHLAGIRAGESGSKDETLWKKVAERIGLFRAQHPKIAVEIEVDTLEQLEFAFTCYPDIVLLDNMNLDQLRSAVNRRNMLGMKTLLEASGGVNLTTIRSIAETRVDRISIGALTHSATALDIGLDYVT
jgi:nicotinate-nucleotide pyrophosphorylase (carboxylating)